ncbi:GNAT family N-acetyltransferase [Francisella frigiditurris]|uniref:Acetyltransferase family protein n=1 Tax=Francisella frigiditurris TaxID=1542390 RepID=A0A1J0KVV0_9GAMM|nr:GNAT family N-acetyltransferase [Francisella frigiditurris]APC97897.1 acetyltransferase family protein [Francisella frigiditurris]
MNLQTLSLSEIYYEDTLNLIRESNYDFSWSDKQIFETFKKKNNIAFGLFNNEELIGISFYLLALDEAELLYITLRKDFRNKGLAYYFLEDNIRSLTKKDIKSIFLEVDLTNLFAIKLYEKLHFKNISMRKNYYKYPNGKTSDALIYQLRIED